MTSFILIHLFAGLHAYYISFTEMEYNPNSKKMETSMKLTAHDLDYELEDLYNLSFKLEDQSDTNHLYIQKYLRDKVVLIQKDERLELVLDGYEYDLSGDLFLFFHFTDFKVKKGFVFQNKILFKNFPEQQNIVHIKIGESSYQKTLTTKGFELVVD